MFIKELLGKPTQFTVKDIKRGNQFLVQRNRFDPYVMHILDVTGSAVRYETSDEHGVVIDHGHAATNRAPDNNKHISVVLGVLNDPNSSVKKLGLLNKVHLTHI